MAQSSEKDKIKSKFEIFPFGSIKKLLELEVPPFHNGVFLQLSLIERHLSRFDNNEKNSPQSCKSILVEEHYIDRAFIDDYSAFYATSFKEYPNSCRRLHFFSINDVQLKLEISNLFEACRNRELSGSSFSHLCEEFSHKYYLGFSVIKPLPGSPVGRTVLRHYRTGKDKDFVRQFNCTRDYKVHLFGLELTVCGLVFQQQDIGVSACATTALWTSLSKLKEFEHLRTPSPAQITKLATQHYLPTGRSMPQENGLSVEQMCQAIQSLGLSPYLIKVADSNKNSIKAYLHSAVLSGFAPILISRKIGLDESNKRLPENSWHAVTVSGMKLHKERNTNPVFMIRENYITEVAGDLEAIYVNDDRFSPYYRVKVESAAYEDLLEFETVKDSQTDYDIQFWKPVSILIPMHSKIRLSLVELRNMAFLVISELASNKLAFTAELEIELGDKIEMNTWISKSSEYVKQLFFGKDKLSREQCEKFKEKISLSRYVGIIRLIDSCVGIIDIIVDTTNIKKNPNYLAVVCRAPPDLNFAGDFTKFISSESKLNCPYIFDSLKA